MITVRNETFYGLSTDTKPTVEFEELSIRNGQLFIEMDTGDGYMYDQENETWIQQ